MEHATWLRALAILKACSNRVHGMMHACSLRTHEAGDESNEDVLRMEPRWKSTKHFTMPIAMRYDTIPYDTVQYNAYNAYDTIRYDTYDAIRYDTYLFFGPSGPIPTQLSLMPMILIQRKIPSWPCCWHWQQDQNRF